MSYARAFGRVILVVCGVAALLAPLLAPAPCNAVWVSAAAIMVYVGLERLAARRWPGRAISLLRATLLISCTPPLFLILALFAQGDATYSNVSGYFSHSDQAWLVALAGVVLLTAALLGALLVGKGIGDSGFAVAELRAGFSPTFLQLMALLAGAHALVRLLLIFAGREVPLGIAYGLRLYLSLYLAVFVFLGMALRLRMVTGRVMTALTVAASGLVLLTGGRSDALFPLLYLSLGYVLAKPTRRTALAKGVALAVPVFLLAMYVGGLVRGDDLGRTGAAALDRVGRLDYIFGEAGDLSTFSDSTLRRMVSNSTHSVITRIPTEVPFEQDGLLKLPGEFADRFLPRFNLSGISETERPRHWILNDLGFLVNWATSVELTLVADAWYRGGWLGVVVSGLILGLFLQLTENAVYRAMRRSPQFSAVLIFVCVGLLQVGARDIVGAVRTVVFLSFAALVVVSLAMALEWRRPGGRRARNLRPVVPQTSPGPVGEAK